MKTIVVAGMLLIGLAVAAQAQGKPPGYVVAELDITDPAVFANEYASKLQATLDPFGGRTIVRGKPIAVEGEPPKTFVVIEFESADKARAWFDSPAYIALKPARERSAKTKAYIVEGVSK
jgi:uncharacterized protein (DUF1330 family)